MTPVTFFAKLGPFDSRQGFFTLLGILISIRGFFDASFENWEVFGTNMFHVGIKSLGGSRDFDHLVSIGNLKGNTRSHPRQKL